MSRKYQRNILITNYKEKLLCELYKFVIKCRNNFMSQCNCIILNISWKKFFSKINKLRMITNDETN